MQLVPRYLLKNTVNVVINLGGFSVEYSPVYNRMIQIYRGIDNIIQFRLFNADQKGVDLTGYTPHFMAWDENENLVLELVGEVQDDGSSVQRGKFSVNITNNSTLDLTQQYLSYTIYLSSADQQNTITYTDTHFGNRGIIYLSSQAFSGAKPSKNITQFTNIDVGGQTYVSETLYAEPAINSNNALHTAVVYASGYVGNVTVQATLENNVTESTEWADLATLEFDGTETEPVPVNYYGVLSHVRFKTDANPSDKITKILVRS